MSRAADVQQRSIDPNTVFLLNSHRAGVAGRGRESDPLSKIEALTTYRDQLRAELTGIDAELAELARGYFAPGT